MTEEIINQIINYKIQHPFCTEKDLNELFGVTGAGRILVSNHCTTYELTGLRCRKYDVKDDYFHVIDTPEKAYILGVLYTDGYLIIEGTKTKRIGLDVADIKWLEGIKDILSPTSPLYETYKKNIKRMKLTSSQMYEDLIRLGCTPNKTFTLTFPTEEQVPKEFLPQFILGMWDGDGSIEICQRTIHKWTFENYKITFTKTKELVEGVQKYLGVEHLKLYQRFPERNKNNYTLQISGNKCVKDALEKIYINPPSICLQRKYNKYIQIMNTSSKGE